MKIAIGADHRGFRLKEFIKKHVASVEWIDVGTHNEDRTDYPLYAAQVIDCMKADQAQYGVLICASGGGMAIAANRYSTIYAVVVWNAHIAELSKTEDNCNVLVFPSDFITPEDSLAMIQVWLEAKFKGGRYAERIAMLD